MMAVKTTVICLMTLLAKTGALDEFSVEGTTSQQDSEGGIADVDWAADQADRMGSDEGATEERSSEGGAHRHDGWASNRTSDARQDMEVDWCELDAQRQRTGRLLEDMLRGHHIKVGVVGFPPLSIVDRTASYGVGDGYMFAGPMVTLFDEMSRRHGANVTYVALPEVNRSSTTVTQYLSLHAPKFDLLVGAFLSSFDRERLGLAFAPPIVDFSLGLYIKRKQHKPLGVQALYELLWLPFDWSAWLGVLAVYGLPILTQAILSGWRVIPDVAVTSLLVLCGVRGPLAIWPRRHRLVGLGMLAWAAAAFVTTGLYQSAFQRALLAGAGPEPSGISNFQGLLCVSQNTFNERLMTRHYKGPIKGVRREDLPKEVVEGTCQGLVEGATVAATMMAGSPPQTPPIKPDAEPYGCQLKGVGRPIVKQHGTYAGFFGGNCQEFVVKVVSTWVGTLGRREVESALLAAIGDRRKHCISTAPEESAPMSWSFFQVQAILMCLMAACFAVDGVLRQLWP